LPRRMDYLDVDDVFQPFQIRGGKASTRPRTRIAHHQRVPVRSHRRRRRRRRRHPRLLVFPRKKKKRDSISKRRFRSLEPPRGGRDGGDRRVLFASSSSSGRHDDDDSSFSLLLWTFVALQWRGATTFFPWEKKKGNGRKMKDFQFFYVIFVVVVVGVQSIV
jgi:hypothetical protein